MRERMLTTLRIGKRLPAVLLAVIVLVIIPVSASVTFGTSCPQTIAKGDTVTISGTGAMNGTVAIWVIGRNYFDVIPSGPDMNGNFSVAIPPEETARFSSGQYAFAIQDPGANGETDIGCRADTDGNITLMNRGTIIADIGPKQGIRANAEPVVKKFIGGTSLPGVDDILTPYYFFVEEPYVHFDQKSGANPDSQLPSVTAGERIAVSGTTNMGVENSLHADIRNLDTNTLISSITIPVIAGNGKNRWSFELDTAGFSPGEYYVTAGWTKSDTTGTGSALFTVVEMPASPLPGYRGPLPYPIIIGGGMLLVAGSIILALRRR